MKKQGWIALCTAATFATAAPLGAAASPVYASTTTYTFAQKSIVLNGQPVMNVMRIVHNGTTYMPVWYLEQVLKKLNIQTTWSGTAWALTLPSSIKPNLANISLGSGQTEVSLNGTPVSRITGVVYQDPNSPHTLTTYLPIYYLHAILLRIGVQSEWNGQTWTLTSGQSAGSGSSSSTSTGATSGSGSGAASSVTGSTTPRSPSYQLTQKSIVLNGQPVMNVMRLVSDGTTYMPVWYLEQILKKVNIQSKWSGTAWALTLPSSMKPNLSNITLGSGKTEVSLNGTPVSRITGIVYHDPYAPNVLTTYLPIYYLHAVLLRVGVQTKWDGQTWTLTTAQTGFETYDSTGKLLNSYKTEADAQAAIASTPGAVVKDGSGTVVYTTPDFAAYEKSGTLVGNYLTEATAQSQLSADPGGTVKDMVNGDKVVYTEPDFAAYDKSGNLIGDYTAQAAAQSQLTADPGGTVKDMVNGDKVVYTEPDFAAYDKSGNLIADYTTQAAAQSQLSADPGGTVRDMVNGGTVVYTEPDFAAYDKSGKLIGDYTTQAVAQSQLSSVPGGTVKDMVNGGAVVYTEPDFAAYSAPEQTPTDYVLKSAAQNAISGKANGFVVNVNLGTVINQPSNVYRLNSYGLWSSSAYGYLGTVVPSFAKAGGVYLVMDSSNSPYMSHFFYLSQNGKYVGQDVGTFENPFRTADLRFPAPSSVTANQIDTWLASNNNSPLQGLGAAFIQAQNTYGVNATYLVAHAIEETGWGRSLIAQQKNNLFGYGAFDSNPGPDAGIFPSNEYAILFQAYEVRNNYLNLGSSHFYQWPTLDGMNEHYATGHTWSTSIADLMNQFVDQTNGSISSYTQYSPSNAAPNPSSSTEPVYYMNGGIGQVLSNPWTNLPVYASSSASSGAITTLPAGTAVTIDSMQMGMDGNYVTEWYHITSGSFTGWADSAYISFKNVYRAMSSSGFSVPIYSTESTAGTPVDTIHTGDYVVSASATPDANGFFTVQMVNQTTGQSYTGYISSSSVSLVPLP